jgi:hypothetical protein
MSNLPPASMNQTHSSKKKQNVESGRRGGKRSNIGGIRFTLRSVHTSTTAYINYSRNINILFDTRINCIRQPQVLEQTVTEILHGIPI